MAKKGYGEIMRTGVKAEWIHRAAWLTAAVLALGLTCAAQSDESLGDVARQNKPAHKAARVVTNDEIPSVAVPVADPSPASSTADAKANSTDGPKAASESSAKDPGSKNSKAGITIPGVLTSGTLEQARSALDTLKHDRQAFLNNYDKIQQRLNDTDNEALRQSYMGIMATRDSTLARNAKQIADTENAIQAAEAAGAQGDNHETK